MKKKNSNEIFPKYFINKDLTTDSYTHYNLDNTFIIFNSINNILYLIYATNNCSIISFNLINNQKIIEIKEAHNQYIDNFNHYFDKNNKRDLIISISAVDNNIKLWNVNNWELLHEFEKVNPKGVLYSANFLYDNNQIYIISSNSFIFEVEKMKIFDFNGNKIKEINDSNYNTFCIKIYLDKNTSKNYIITGNFGFIQSFDYEQNIFYHKYDDEVFISEKNHYFHIILFETNIINMIGTCKDSYIRIWNFHSGKLLMKVHFNKVGIAGICLWNKDYLYAACTDTTIKLIEIRSGKILQSLIGHYRVILNVKKLNHPIYGECLISQCYGNELMKIWISS